MPITYEILILILMSVLLVFQVNHTTGAGGLSFKELQLKPGKVNEEKYVRYIAHQPILEVAGASSSKIAFDGDVYYSTEDIPWDWNDSHQQPPQKPALYLADPFINIQHAPGQFQAML